MTRTRDDELVARSAEHGDPPAAAAAESGVAGALRAFSPGLSWSHARLELDQLCQQAAIYWGEPFAARPQSLTAAEWDALSTAERTAVHAWLTDWERCEGAGEARAPVPPSLPQRFHAWLARYALPDQDSAGAESGSATGMGGRRQPCPPT